MLQRFHFKVHYAWARDEAFSLRLMYVDFYLDLRPYEIL